MARLQKFPIPTVDKEIPYDKDGFIDWCVRESGLTDATAKKYAADVKTAYLTVFEENNLFEDIEEAFTTMSMDEFPEDWRQIVTKDSLLVDKLADIEDAYELLLDHIYELDAIDEYGDIYIETSTGEEVPLPKKEWLRAFRTYANYIRWRINDICSRVSFPRLPFAKEEFVSIPLSKEFSQYLKSLHKKQSPEWKPRDSRRKNSYQGESGTYSWISRLTKLYNNILITKIPSRVLTHLDWLLRNRQCFWSDKDKERLFNCIDYARKSNDYKDISENDYSSGRRALELYFDFMKAYSEDPDRYQPEPKTRKGKI